MEEAKLDRSNAKRAVTRWRKQTIEAINAEDDLEIVNGRFEECRKSWVAVQNKHELYISQLDQENEEFMEAEEMWLEEIQHNFLEVERMKIHYVKKLQEETAQINREKEKRVEEEKEIRKKEHRERDIEKAQQIRQLEEVTFTHQAETLKDLIETEKAKEKPVLFVVRDAQNDFKEQLEKCRKAQSSYILLLDSGRAALEMEWIGKLQKIYIEVNKIVGEFLQKYEMKSTDNHTVAKQLSNSGLRLERMKMPSFDGNIRDYPRFKTDFTKQVLPEFKTPESAAYALKSCLSKVPYEIVRNVDDDLSEMWKRLDEKYGKTSKLTEAVMYDIKKTIVIKDGEDKRFIDFVDTIESGYRDLARMKVEHELSNTTVISLMEEKLPKNIRREWSKKVNEEDSKVDDSNRFPSFLKFLLEQKRILEYESADIRMSGLGISGHAHHVDNIASEDDVEEVASRPRSTRCLVHNTNTHMTAYCRAYLEKPPEERIELLKTKRACWSCLKVGHRSADCKFRKKCSKDGCDKFHHELLHEAHVQGVAFHANTSKSSESEGKSKRSNTCLLQLMRVKSGTQPAIGLNILWDGGATISLITFTKAREMGLIGEPTKICVVKVGGQKEEMSSYVYELPVVDKCGTVVHFQVYGIDKISSEVHRKNLKDIKSLFQGLTQEEIVRPSGEIDALIGFEYAGYHPVREQSSDHLLVLGNRFGRCIGGSHPLLEENTKKVIQHVSVLHIDKVRIEDFYETETMGVECSPRCGGCRCGRCPIGGKEYTLKEERELHMIEQGLTHKQDHWEAQYPWIRDPNELPDNRVAAFAMLRSTERRLSRNSEHAQVYCEQIHDMVKRGVARKLLKEEVTSYTGPVFYLSHHEVLKPDSTSTPCRIVFNSSASFKGHVLNNYWAKGPDLLNNLLGVLIRFRENEVALTGDIRKMYHAVKIPEHDQHTHRFLWRDMQTDREPDTYVVTSVSFGDRPAGNMATMALRKTAEMGRNQYPDAADMILKNTYVDDIVDSVRSVHHAKTVTGNIEKLLKPGGFAIKHWVVSHEQKMMDRENPPSEEVTCKDQESNTIFKKTSSDQNHSDSERVFGMHWISDTDDFRFTVRVNFSPRRRKMRTGPDLHLDQIPRELPATLSKRMILSQVNGIYDPMGLATPFTMKAKILMRRLWSGEEQKLGWDEDIPNKLKGEWISFFRELFAMKDVTFKRCIRPQGAINNPSLIMFSDGSQDAFGTCAYARWELQDGRFESSLIAAKGRIAPVKKISVVRLELNGAVLSKRLYNFIKQETRLHFEKEFFIIDSQIVRAMLQKESYGFNTFAGLRIGEIQNSTCSEDWAWVESSLNIADWTTRGKHPSELGEGSTWQKGPQFLQLPESEWPIKTECYVNDLPEQSKIAMTVQHDREDSLAKRIGIERYSSYTKLIRVTARILAMFDKNPTLSFRNALKTPDAEVLKRAELFWIREAQRNLKLRIDKGDFHRLNPTRQEDGIITVQGRVEKWMELSYDHQPLPLLPKDHRFCILYAEHVHRLSHLGASSIVSKIRLRFWITGLARMVKLIGHRCVACKKLNKEFMSQRMAQLPLERLRPTTPWQYTGIDFFGPFQTRGEVNKRARGKAYGLIFNCFTSRAVYIDVATDYSTEGFLMPFRRFVSLRGYPEKVNSDCGSQLVAASKEMRDVVKGLDQEKLKEFGADMGMHWNFTTPDGPWRNGCSEALIKSVKKAIKCAVGEQVLSFSELQTVSFEAANLVNERPIGRHPTSPEDGTYLCPNLLLFGRATTRVPAGPFKEPTSLKHRFEFVQKIVDSFWRRWTRDFFPSLLIHQKWYTEKRNVKVGDIVLAQDSNQVRGNWRLARISKVFPSDDGLVRRAELEYKNFLPNQPTKVYAGRPYTTIERPVQRLVVIVAVDDVDDVQHQMTTQRIPKSNSVS